MSHRRARHSWAHRPLPFLQLRTRCQLFGRSSPRPSLSSYLCSVISVPCAGRLNAHGTRRSASPPHYPATFEALIPPLQRPLPSTIINIPSLLARLQLTHHRLGPLQRSPPFLVPFFWPWACCATFPITYLEYLCATNAMEHVRLAFVRWQDASSSDSSGLLGGPASAVSLGVPTRPKGRIRSHPPYSLRTSRLVTLSHRRLLSLGSCFDIGPMALGTTRSGPTSTSVTPFVDVAAAAAVGAHPFLVFSSSSSSATG